MPSLAAVQRVVTFSDEPEIMHVYVPYMEHGRTHKHSLKRARRTHRKVRKAKAEPSYPSKKDSAVQVWADRVVSCLERTFKYEWVRLIVLLRISKSGG